MRCTVATVLAERSIGGSLNVALEFLPYMNEHSLVSACRELDTRTGGNTSFAVFINGEPGERKGSTKNIRW